MAQDRDQKKKVHYSNCMQLTEYHSGVVRVNQLTSPHLISTHAYTAGTLTTNH